MAVYGITPYGGSTNVYGLSLPPAYVLPSFSARPSSYTAIRLTWGKPSGNVLKYRLVANRYGYPVNEADGTILFDQVAYPGNAWTDQAIVPGTYHHYGFYVLADESPDVWIRAGVAACLAPGTFGSAQWLWDRLPAHFTELPDGSDLTGDASNNSYLMQYLGVLGWGWDYLQTQYTMLAQTLNSPWDIPENDLMHLAAEVGLDFAPGTPAYAMRKGVQNQATVSRQRGTPLGLANEITIRTGWGADVQLGPNMLLTLGQSTFMDPVFEPWVKNVTYQVGECVWTGTTGTSRVWSGEGYWYQCIAACQNIAPPSNGTSTSYWQALSTAPDFTGAQTNPNTSNPSTWEALNPANPGSFVTTGTFGQSLGVANITGTGYAWNAITVTNTTPILTPLAATVRLRSVSRATSDVSQIPDPGFEAGFTIPPVGVKPPLPTWVPTSWPRLYSQLYQGGPVGSVPAFPGQRNENLSYLESAWWTSQTMSIAHHKGRGHSGGYCAALSVPSANAAAGSSIGSPWVACPAGEAVSASAWLNSQQNCNAVLSIQFRNSHGAIIGTPPATAPTALTGYGSGVGTYTKLSLSATSPSGTAYVSIAPTLTGTGAITCLLDDVNISAGTAGQGLYPDPAEVINNGVPVPWVRDSQQWVPATRYGTGDIVLYQGMPFQALRASTGSIPPGNYAASTDWTPLSESRRIRICESAYTSWTTAVVGTDDIIRVTPYVEWYDQHGNFISQVFARNTTDAGATSRPPNLTFDSFTGTSRISAVSGTGAVNLPAFAASFWANSTMSGAPAFTRTDAAVNFTWSGEAPCQSVGSAGWSGQWVTTFTPADSGTYSFTLTSPGGGSRLEVGDVTVIDNWTSAYTTPQSGSIPLNAGQAVMIVVSYAAPPTAPGGTWSGNLLPDGWQPAQAGAERSWTSPLFPVVAGYGYKLVLTATAHWNTGAFMYGQVVWYNNSGTALGQASAELHYTQGVLTTGPSGTAPVGATWALVNVTATGTDGGAALLFSTVFEQIVPPPVTSGLTLSAPVSYTTLPGSTVQSSPYIGGRITDDAESTWQSQIGSFTVGQGIAHATIPGQRSYALVTGQANTQVAVTLKSSPTTSGLAQGLILRYTDDTSYIRCDRTGLRYVNGTNWITIAAHSTAFADGDRMTVNLNGPAITVYRNGVQVSSASSTYNSNANTHGIITNDVAVST
jgi:hypothetical protein